MIAWVYQRAHKASVLSRLLVATDSAAILSYCSKNGFGALLTSREHASGTDRLIEVMEQETALGRAADIYVNIQGDEPMVSAAHIELLVRPFLKIGPTGAGEGLANSPAEVDFATGPSVPAQVSTLRVAISPEAARDPNVVKVVTDCKGLALYFSRAVIPYDRDASDHARYYKHLGFYAYTPEALRRFRSLKPSLLEQTECLEQLRILENGIPITVLETTDDTIGVDTEEDLLRVEEYFRRTGLAAEPHR
jgi:3-deoxy-manno-octulosonate cytidylyltransferase (CMP-KDO synthetase)